MATSIDQAFIKQYEREVHMAFQRRGSQILPTVRRKPNVTGTTTTFQKAAKGAATTKSRHGTITPMNIVHTNVTATMADFYAGDWVDKLDELKINIDERRVLSESGAWALGRKIDNQLATTLNTTSNTIAHGSAALTLAKIQEAFWTLGENDVFESGKTWFITGFNGWSDLLGIEQFASADYVDSNFPSLDGVEMKRFFGINFFPTEATADQKSGSTYLSFMYHEDSVGYGMNSNITADITWHGDRASHFVNHWMSGGSVMIDDNGVIEVQHQ
jgi:hypothetical protein